ncbi:zinc finger protein 551-like [Silurus asotus]|uniref:Zinc finger protein 551-like n=1 Tax=Silurus asotus TaxID=30991 RepID=A0AAD5F8Q1_SILAS|nr:zinc finger protein 551-like [Silurus asotus]
MVDSHFHVQLTAVMDVLLKTAVSDICALAESWFKSLHTEIARSKKENEDLRQKLQMMEQEKHQPAVEPEAENATTKQEKDDGVEVRDTDDTELNGGFYVLGNEFKTESEKSQPVLQSSECRMEVGLHCSNQSEKCVLLDEVCAAESPHYRREEEQQFDVSCLWTPDLEPNSTHLLRENQSAFTNSDHRMALHLGKDFSLAVAPKTAKHLNFSKRTSISLLSEKGNVCNICGKNLSTKNSLASHYRLHTGEKPFMCAQCGKSFAKKFNLDIHYNIHSGLKPYMCAHCPKSFADPSAFRRHEWMHTRKSPQNTKYKFSCNTCGKCFLSKQSLAAHSQLHTAEKQHGVQKVLF